MGTIITKNGSGSAVPLSLIQGELAINVDTGTLYYGSGSTNAVRTITASLGLTASYVTSSNVYGPYGSNSILSASWARSSSYAITASYVRAAGSDTQIQFNASGNFSASSAFTYNYISESLQHGLGSTATGLYSRADGFSTQAKGANSHAEGLLTIASGSATHAEGQQTTAIGTYSHTEGLAAQTLGSYTHAEGYFTIAQGDYSHAEGDTTQAIGGSSHAEGSLAISRGLGSHAEGRRTEANANYSHAEGSSSIAAGIGSHAEGLHTIASGAFQHTMGQFNLTSSAQSAFIIGNGTSNTSRSNLVFASGSTFQVTGSINLSGSQYFSTTDAGVNTTGQIGWNTGDQTFDIGLSGSVGNIPVLQIGQQQVARVYNAQGTTLTKGQVVYISGSQGNRIAVKLASATNDANSAGTLGFVLDPIAAGAEGYITTGGPLYKLNTTGYAEGELIYLSSSAGEYTHTKPVAPLHEVRLGYVERVHATVGSIYVKIDNGYELGELHDVLDTTTTSSFGDLLVKSGSVWHNSKQLTGSYGLTGSLQATSFTGSLFGTASWAISAISSSRPIAVTGSTIYSTSPLAGINPDTINSIFLSDDAGAGAINASNSNFLGYRAGVSATNAADSNFLGQGAGFEATDAQYSNFLGNNAGNSATNAANSNFLGPFAGENATDADNSNFLGQNAGSSATNANNSNFLGQSAGSSAINANSSNFLGQDAGADATNAYYSNFLGNSAGRTAASASYSTLIGYQVGFNASATDGIASNNIIIGTNITLPDQSKDSINLGAIIFATGSFNDVNAGEPFSGSVAPSVGRVGINIVTPLYNLDVSGSGNFSNNLTISGSTFITGLTTTSQTNVLTYNSTTGQVFFTASSAIGGGGGSTVKAGSGSVASFGGSPLTSSITFGSAFSNNSYAVTVTGEDARSWTIQSKSSTGFTINSNSSTGLTGPVYWIATPFSS